MTRRTRGFTLPEITLAMAIAAVVGLTVVSVSMALSTAYVSSEDHYQNLQTARSVMERIRTTIRKSKLVTYSSVRYLALWAEDTNNNGQINLDEVVVLFYVPTLQEIRHYQIRFPDSMDPSMVAVLNLSVSLETATESFWVPTILSHPYVTRTTLGTSVQSLELTCRPVAPLTDFVKIELTVREGDSEVTLRSAACLLTDMTDSVGIMGGEYVLDSGLSDKVKKLDWKLR